MEAKLTWLGECLIGGGTLTIHLPDGDAVVVANPVPCLGDATVDAEGCLVGQDSYILTDPVPYTVQPGDVVGGLVSFSVDWDNGVAHESPTNNQYPVDASVTRQIPVDGSVCTGTGAATGMFTVTLDTSVQPPFPLTGAATFDDVIFDVFGTPVNLGTAVGTVTLDGGGWEFSGVPASAPFSVGADSVDPGVMLTFEVLGHSICTSPACTSGTWSASFVGDVGNVVDPNGVLPANPDIVYVDDGLMQCTSMADSAECTGTFAFNAFVGQPTPADTEPVTVTFPNVVLPPVEGAGDISTDIDVIYTSVETAGQTLVTVKSNVPNFSVGTSVPLVTFFDVSTTATVTAPIVLCATYADANDDGMLDVSNETVHECGLRIYHFEVDPVDGIEKYVDKTLAADDPACPLTLPTTLPPCALDGQVACLDRIGNKLCAAVDGLSPFAIAVVSNGDVPVAATKLIVVDKKAISGKGKVVFVAKDALAGITKGTGTDVGAIETTMAFGYGSTSAVFLAPAGAITNGAGWVTNKATVAKYVNKAAPAGPTGAKVVVIKPGKLLKLVARSLGDRAIDIHGAGPPTTDVTLTFTVQNGAQRFRHCTTFPLAACSYKLISAGQGAKLVCKGGLPTPCP